MSKPRNELAEFVIGAAMLCVGFYLLTQKVTVSNSFFGGHMTYFGMRLNTGVVFIPLIVGIIMIFVKPESFLSKLVFGISILIVLASIITSTTMRLTAVSLSEWIIYLVLIFGGLGLTLRVLLKNPDSENSSSRRKNRSDYTSTQTNMDDELNDLKDTMKKY